MGSMLKRNMSSLFHHDELMWSTPEDAELLPRSVRPYCHHGWTADLVSERMHRQGFRQRISSSTTLPWTIISSSMLTMAAPATTKVE